MDTLKDFLIMMFSKFKISFATIFLLIIPLSILPYDGSNKFVDNVDIRKQFDSLIRRGDANIYGFVREFHDTVWYDSLRNCLSKNPDDKEVSLKLVTYEIQLGRLLNDSAIYNYKNALLIYPEDDEALLKLAIIYDEMDSVKLAEKYYKKVKKRFITLTNNYTNTEYPEIDVNKLKMNLTYCDSLEILFKQYGRESSVTFDIEIATSVFPTYNNDHVKNFLNNLFRKKIFITVYGNGDFEARKFDSLKKSKVFFEGKLPDSTLSKILNTLQKGKILSFKSLFQEDEKSVNRFFWSIFFLFVFNNPQQ